MFNTTYVYSLITCVAPYCTFDPSALWRFGCGGSALKVWSECDLARGLGADTSLRGPLRNMSDGLSLHKWGEVWVLLISVRAPPRVVSGTWPLTSRPLAHLYKHSFSPLALAFIFLGCSLFLTTLQAWGTTRGSSTWATWVAIRTRLRSSLTPD